MKNTSIFNFKELEKLPVFKGMSKENIKQSKSFIRLLNIVNVWDNYETNKTAKAKQSFKTHV